MDGLTQERRGLFDGLKVPHSGNAVLIASLALLVYWLGIRAIESGLDVPGETSCRLLAGMLANASYSLGYPGTILGRVGGWGSQWQSFTGMQWVAFVGWTIVTWAFFVGAITRIAAMKIARDEGLELREALRFGARRFLSNIGSVAFVFVIVGFFYLATNASLAGGIGRIPGVGGVILGILFVLVLVASFLIVLAAALGLLGFNIAAAAISTEVSDAFDGVSRAWDYLLSRPWHVILTHLATFIYLALVVCLGNLFLEVSVKSLTVSWWGLGDAPRAVEVDEATRKALQLPADMDGLKKVYLPGRADYIHGRVIAKNYRPDEEGRIYYQQGIDYALERYKSDTGAYPASLRDLIYEPTPAAGNERARAWKGPYYFANDPPRDAWSREYAYRTPSKLDPTRGYDLFSRGNDAGPEADHDDIHGREAIGIGHGPKLNVAPLVEPTLDFAARGISIWLNVARLLLYGYCIAYFLSAQTLCYFLLRKEVEGEDYSEIVLEDAEQDDAPLEPAPPEKPLPAPSPPALGASTPPADKPAAPTLPVTPPPGEAPKP